MREIKFRAWAAKYKQMYWFDIMWGNKHATGSGWIGMLPISETERGYGLYRDNRVDVDPNDCELMQYTGLKDKNGKEIYEGDVCELRLGDLFVGSFKAKVIYEEGSFGVIPLGSETDIFGNKYSGKMLAFYPSYKPDLLEIVGNVYENHEKLNSEQEVKASVATEVDSSNADGKING